MSWKKGSHETPMSVGPSFSAVTIEVAQASAAVWQMTAPRGSPVEPDVNWRKAVESPSPGRGVESAVPGAITTGTPQSMVAMAGVVTNTESFARCSTGSRGPRTRSGAPSTTGQGIGTAAAPRAWAAKKAATKSGPLGSSTPMRSTGAPASAAVIAPAHSSADWRIWLRLSVFLKVPV